MYLYPDIGISIYIDIQITAHADIQRSIYTPISIAVYMDIRPIETCFINRPSLHLYAKNTPITHFFAPCGITPVFCFVLCKLCFCTYGSRRTHKNQLAPKQPGSGGAGLLRGRKKVATPFFSCKAYHNRRRATNINKPLKPLPC